MENNILKLSNSRYKHINFGVQMRKLILYSLLLFILAGCGNSGNGELTGVKNRPRFYQPDPYGMVYIPAGSYTMGVGDEDMTSAQVSEPKTITVSAFYMDQTEITNNEYRQFVSWIRDSIARTILAKSKPNTYLIPKNRKTGEVYDPPYLNSKAKIKWNGKTEVQELEQMYLPVNERYFRKRQLDPRKLFYEYFWIDMKAAAAKEAASNGAVNGAWANRSQGYKDRSVYVRHEKINVYPDTLTWIHDYSYSYNDPMTAKYFWHPAFDNYPVVGVNWNQARAFCIWRTQMMESHAGSKKNVVVNDFRLPTEAEWEWAARGGNTLSPYPWGGPYTRTAKGCFLANFKPMRGDYAVDGGATTMIVAHFPANDFGLYDMAGNVAEWTLDAFDESSYNMTWDMNPAYFYNTKETDPPAMKRKVIRGGSWKDVAHYIQTSTRSYEYQDSAKCYIGFRCVQQYMGSQKKSNGSRSSRVY
jgi:formylglycine-generating enzyme